MGTRSGPVRDRIAEFQMTFTRFVRELVVTAIARGELGPAVDPDGLTFELNGIILAADAAFVLRGDPAVLDLAAAVVRSRLTALEGPRRPSDDHLQAPDVAAGGRAGPSRSRAATCSTSSSPSAMSMTSRNASSSVSFGSRPFRSAKTATASQASRLFPSTRAWFRVSE